MLLNTWNYLQYIIIIYYLYKYFKPPTTSKINYISLDGGF